MSDPVTSVRRRANAFLALFLTVITVGLASYYAFPARADSEASSEAGTESASGMRRRTRRAMARQRRMEVKRERKTNQTDQREENHVRKLNGNNTTKNWNRQRRNNQAPNQ
jgi:hypothetical protein